jgi:hypothetical protein
MDYDPTWFGSVDILDDDGTVTGILVVYDNDGVFVSCRLFNEFWLLDHRL